MIRPTLLLSLAIAAVDATGNEQNSHFATMSDAIEARDYRKIEAVIVEQGGEIVFEQYYRRSDAQSRIDARSAGKSITALAVGIAVDQGLLDVEDRVFSFFTDRAPIEHDGEIKQAITIEDFLTMSSALECSDWYRKSPGNEERMYRTRDWTRFALDIPIDENYMGPRGGRRFSYCTAGAFLLGRVVERATGEPFDEFVQTHLFGPLGIEDPIWRKAPNGEVQSGGQLSLRARDFAALGRLVLDGGVRDGHTVVSREWLREIFTPRRSAGPDTGYGYLWWLRQFSAGDQGFGAGYMSGNGGNKVALFPELDAVVVILSTNYNRRGMHEQTDELIERYILPGLVDDELASD